jgi:hypothetical protein
MPGPVLFPQYQQIDARALELAEKFAPNRLGPPTLAAGIGKKACLRDYIREVARQRP